MAERRREGPRPSLTISDPQVLKAFAHPARQRLVNELTSGAELTATEAADLVGLSPSAVSHHLRALERYGIAERIPATPGEHRDGRTRPWRSRIRDLNFDAKGAASGLAAQALLSRALADLQADISTAIDIAAAEDGTPRAVGWSSKETWLTDEELLDAVTALQAAFDGIPTRHSKDHPAGAKRYSFVHAHAPVSPDRPQ